MIEEIPVLGPEQRNEARRLMILIDVLYDNGVGLIASAAAEPHALYVDGTGAESFARTASRLMEMRSRPIWPSGIGGAVRAGARLKAMPRALARCRNCQ